MRPADAGSDPSAVQCAAPISGWRRRPAGAPARRRARAPRGGALAEAAQRAGAERHGGMVSSAEVRTSVCLEALMTRIVLIGAGSVEFTRNLLGDFLSYPELHDAPLP